MNIDKDNKLFQRSNEYIIFFSRYIKLRAAEFIIYKQILIVQFDLLIIFIYR